MQALLRKLRMRFGLRSLSRASQFEENQYVASVQPDGLPTNFFQKRLPRLPVPDLQSSCTNILNSMRVFLSSKELLQSQRAMNAFVNGSGKKLQERIVQSDERLRRLGSTKSYIRESFETREATISRSSILTSNEVAPFHSGVFGEQDRLVNLSNLVVSFLRFMKSIDDNVLSPTFISPGVDFSDMMDTLAAVEPTKAMEIVKQYGAIPGCPNRLLEIFRGSRLPRHGRDERRLVSKAAGIRHIVVLHHGRIWKVKVLDDIGRVCNPLHVWHALNYIRQQPSRSDADGGGEKIALCTAAHRDLWATLRNSLRESETNRNVLREIDEALFAVALEEEQFNDASSEALGMFIGEYGNRYLDKDFQLISNGNGRFAAYADEIWATGIPVMRVMEEVADDMRQSASSRNRHLTDEEVRSLKVPHVQPGAVQELTLSLNNDHLNLYEQAQAQYDTVRRNCDVHIATLPFSVTFAKQRSLSADFLVQQSIQTAYHSLFAGRMPVQSETCSLGAFLDGSTESMLTTSPRTKRIAETLNGGLPEDIYYPAVYAPLLVLGASAEHRDRIEQTRSGDTPVNHLVALRYEALKAAGPFGFVEGRHDDVPAFLKCAAVKRLEKIDVDTAQVTKRGIVDMPIGGRWNEGSIRVTYTVQEDTIQYSIMLMRNEVPVTARQFATEIKNAALRLRQLIERTNVSEDQDRQVRSI